MLEETSESVASHLVGKLREPTKNQKGTLVMGPSPIVTYSIKCFFGGFFLHNHQSGKCQDLSFQVWSRLSSSLQCTQTIPVPWQLSTTVLSVSSPRTSPRLSSMFSPVPLTCRSMTSSSDPLNKSFNNATSVQS